MMRRIFVIRSTIAPSFLDIKMFFTQRYTTRSRLSADLQMSTFSKPNSTKSKNSKQANAADLTFNL